MFQVMPPQGGIFLKILKMTQTICFKSCPRKGASAGFAPFVCVVEFQVMPPQGGITVEVKAKMTVDKRFQVMPPQGGIDVPSVAKWIIKKFQVMPPQGGILSIEAGSPVIQKFQVMPPQGGIYQLKYKDYILYVSSHAPARGHPR